MAGNVTTLAGNVSGYADGSGTNAKLFNIGSIAVESTYGQLFVADYANKNIRRVSPTGFVGSIVVVWDIPRLTIFVPIRRLCFHCVWGR